MAALPIKDFNMSSSFDSKDLSPEELRVQEELEIELPHCISPTTFCALAALAPLLKPTYLWVLANDFQPDVNKPRSISYTRESIVPHDSRGMERNDVCTFTRPFPSPALAVCKGSGSRDYLIHTTK